MRALMELVGPLCADLSAVFMPNRGLNAVASPRSYTHVAADDLFERFIGKCVVLVGFLDLFGFGDRLVGFRGLLVHLGPPWLAYRQYTPPLTASRCAELGPVFGALVVVGGKGGPMPVAIRGRGPERHSRCQYKGLRST